ncbi:hypothetical protein ABZ078_43010 [Streptomyces sp. NPDC006385]|uniref:hypothetical protein n=1 Tax=Streptomyces sp. NPDC006385 TaxID=3156761 RepID=UPI0033A83BA0
MSDEQNSDVQPGRLTRSFARLRQARRRWQADRGPLDEAAERAADDLEDVDRRAREPEVRWGRRRRLSWEEAAERAAADLEGR